MLRQLTRIAHQRWLILRRFSRKKSVKVLKARTRGPVIKRSFVGDLLFGSIMPLAPGSGVVAVVFQDFCYCRRRLRNGAAETIEIIGDGSNLPVADSRMIPSGQ